MVRISSLGLVLAAAACAASTASSNVTFSKDVLPILQKNCQGCHRPDEAAPMALLSYKDARPWAKAIKGAVLERKMPPWLADRHYGKFENDRSLSQSEIQTIVSWVDAGAPEGNPKDAPAAVNFVGGWNIGRPDLVYQLPTAFTVPANGTVEYQYVVLPTGFTEDKWIRMAEVRPGNRAVVHHVIAFIRPPGSDWMADAKPGVPFAPKAAAQRRAADPQASSAPAGQARQRNNGGGGIRDTELLVGYAPGLQPTSLREGEAKLVKAGSDIVLQLHYTANGKEATDQSSIGVIFAKEPPAVRVVTMNATNARFAIPPGDSNYEVHSQVTFGEEVKLVDLMPHMHLRGKDFVYKLVYPSGESETVLDVPRYDFNWQLSYVLAKPLLLPKGTRMECTAHFDNSANNPANPDPKKEVRWGDQSWEEMMIGWFDVAIDAHGDPGGVLKTGKTD
jgi:hypothetical protein